MEPLKYLVCLLILMFTTNHCYCQNLNNRSWEFSENSSSPLEIINQRDTLIISFQASECGEWGGHHEFIFIQRQKDNEIAARIVIDTVTCNDIIEQNGLGILNPDNRRIIIDYTKILNSTDEQLISEFLQRLLELYLKPLVVGNFGNLYEVRNTNNSLYFNYWNSGNIMDTHYSKLKKEIFGKLK